MFPQTSQRGNDSAAGMFHRTADFGADSLRMLSHVGFGVSSPFLYSYHAITQKGSLGNDFQRHLQNSNMIKKDVRTFMQKVMPANQNSRAYQTSSMITTGALDGIALGSAAVAGYQFINKAASLTNNALTAMKDIRLQPTNASTAEMFPTNRLQSGPDIKQMIKSVKNVIIKDKNMFDQKFLVQLQKQFDKHGTNSVIKSYKSLRKLHTEHLDKLKNIRFTSSVKREIKTFGKQIDTLELFAKKNNINLP